MLFVALAISFLSEGDGNTAQKQTNEYTRPDAGRSTNLSSAISLPGYLCLAKPFAESPLASPKLCDSSKWMGCHVGMEHLPLPCRSPRAIKFCRKAAAGLVFPFPLTEIGIRFTVASNKAATAVSFWCGSGQGELFKHRRANKGTASKQNGGGAHGTTNSCRGR